MIKSMTGFGKAVCETGTRKYTIEIRSLNGKQPDLNLRVPGIFKEKELEVRTEALRLLERGKIEINIYMEITGADDSSIINREVVQSYYKQLCAIADELLIAPGEYMLPAILRFPDVLKTDRREIDEKEWNELLLHIRKALEELDMFRIQEGKAIEKDLLIRIKLISGFLTGIGKYEKNRIENTRKKIEHSFNELFNNGQYDKNRFEQELIYYLEKLDITEEKNRLANHCDYFLKTLNEKTSQGRKLGFIAQEMGREINTIGSKANDPDIQKLVVQMKDELEKIKEQLLNIL
ncbi:MAG: YicC family protein [Bacteroidetes bacterium]|nr:YicC family protein [Bacteroidota bacterium]